MTTSALLMVTSLRRMGGPAQTASRQDADRSGHTVREVEHPAARRL